MGKSKRKLSCLIHACNDERRLGRTLESLRTCDDIVVVDHGSTDKTGRVARQYGARVVPGVAGVDKGAYAVDCANDWVLCLMPGETVSEPLEAALFEWKQAEGADGPAGFALQLREEEGQGWKQNEQQMRLVDRSKINWQDEFPILPEVPVALPGEILRVKD